ncbi:hypothetical protein D3C85_655310 [compost metagenome]
MAATQASACQRASVAPEPGSGKWSQPASTSRRNAMPGSGGSATSANMRRMAAKGALGNSNAGRLVMICRV